jgi:hypothetical protein
MEAEGGPSASLRLGPRRVTEADDRVMGADDLSKTASWKQTMRVMEADHLGVLYIESYRNKNHRVAPPASPAADAASAEPLRIANPSQNQPFVAPQSRRTHWAAPQKLRPARADLRTSATILRSSSRLLRHGLLHGQHVFGYPFG